MGLFPLGTSFEYYRHLSMIPSLDKARLNLSVSFSFTEKEIDKYDAVTGKPWWSGEPVNEWKTGNGQYFKAASSIDLYLGQGFGRSINGKDPLTEIRLGFHTVFQNAKESLTLSQSASSFQPLFVDGSGNAAYPFDGTLLYGTPWLMGSRDAWNSYMYIKSIWNFRKSTGAGDAYDGAYAEATCYYGPRWLFNQGMGVPVSDFAKLEAIAEEYITIFTSKQKNGWNWTNLFLGHYNELSYIFGDTVPPEMLNLDHLRGSFIDRLYIRFVGPQFIASDCFTYIELGFTNKLLFGKAMNDASHSYTAIEYRSAFDGIFHMRLFGFIRIEYRFEYSMANGLEAIKPHWSQDASLRFYVSL